VQVKTTRRNIQKQNNILPSDLENLINALQKVKADADEQGIKTAYEPKKRGVVIMSSPERIRKKN